MNVTLFLVVVGAVVLALVVDAAALVAWLRNQGAKATWVDQHHPVEQITWAPGKPMSIKNLLINKVAG
jgi:hypothetical protein